MFLKNTLAVVSLGLVATVTASPIDREVETAEYKVLGGR